MGNNCLERCARRMYSCCVQSVPYYIAVICKRLSQNFLFTVQTVKAKRWYRIYRLTGVVPLLRVVQKGGTP